MEGRDPTGPSPITSKEKEMSHPYLSFSSRKDPLGLLRRKKTLKQLNFDIDNRHYQGNPITPALTDEDCAVRVCVGCRRAVTEWEVRYYGCCPQCYGHTQIGGYGTFISELRIWWWNITKNWRIHGPCPAPKHSPQEAEALLNETTVWQDEKGNLLMR